MTSSGITGSERPQAAPARPQRVVVDTNVWLDMYFFRDPQSRKLEAIFDSPLWNVARCEQTDAELSAVLQRARFSPSPAEQSRLLESLRDWQARTVLFPLLAQAPLRCRDRHDQKFLDLAFSVQAAVLLTKDKALLALARKARGFGVQILSPREFERQFG